ncbi:hypothetical protein VTO42DRAFT_1760 [Malbranchea cinnamomea]
MFERFAIVFQGPPGPSISRPTPSDPYPAGNPLVFTHAMNVRDTVFVEEQKCDPDAELDDDDPRSWQWVMYDTMPPPPDPEASTATNGNGAAETTEANLRKRQKPVAVVRLVPPPHAPHEHLRPVIEDGVDTTETHRKLSLPFIRLTRVAVLPEYRGLGLSRVLVETALRWAAEHPEEIDKAHLDATGGKAGGRWDGLVLVHAQTQVEGLYERLGFVTDKGLGTWEEERIVHVGMWRELKVRREN